MAAVTLVSRGVNINGNRKEVYYKVTGSNSQTLQTEFHLIEALGNTQPGTITNITIGTTAPIVLTFTSTGTFTNALVTATGH